MSFVPIFATRSQVACWMSALKLIREHSGDAWLWTFTFAEVLPNHYASNIHRRFTQRIADAQREGRWPNGWGALKVVEVHPGGHGLHFHWLSYPRLDVNNVRPIARDAGFGRIHVHPDTATERAATYLAKYLTKGNGVTGCKVWACLGTFEGVRVQDVEIQSHSVDVFRAAYREAIASGKSKAVAYNYARLQQREYDHNRDDRD